MPGHEGERTLTLKSIGARKAPARTKSASKRTKQKPPTKKQGRRNVTLKRATNSLDAVDRALLDRVRASLDDDKAEDIVVIDLEGRSSLADALVIATGRSSRHVAAIAEHLARRLKDAGYGTRPINGAQQGDWVLVDAGDVIVHVFRSEVRDYYDLEGMWSVKEPQRGRAAG
jgi:ribosome silencing factor RsfS/YbeB/iojap